MYDCKGCMGLSPDPPWKCPVCGKEVCETCFDRYGVCRECTGDNKTDEEVKAMLITGGWEWEN